MCQWRHQRGNPKTTGDKLKVKQNIPKFLGCTKSTSKREIYSYTGFEKEIRKISDNKIHLPPERIIKL